MLKYLSIILFFLASSIEKKENKKNHDVTINDHVGLFPHNYVQGSPQFISNVMFSVILLIYCDF